MVSTELDTVVIGTIVSTEKGKKCGFKWEGEEKSEGGKVQSWRIVANLLTRVGYETDSCLKLVQDLKSL